MKGNYGEEVSLKVHDISFAVFRVAAQVGHLKLKSELEEAAVLLVSNPGDLDILERLERLVALAEATGYIRPVNSHVLLRELSSFKSVVPGSDEVEEEINLEELFRKKEEPIFKQKNRQSAILDFIRQLPNGCRMRELTQQFPQVSERTLRNDLQTLVLEGLVERVGIQGPTSYFRAPIGVGRPEAVTGPDNVTQKGIIAL